MRYLTLTFPRRPESDTYDVIVPDLAVRRGTLLNLNLLYDGTIVELCRLDAPRSELVADLESWENTISFEVLESDGDGLCVFVHYRPNEKLEELLRLTERHRLLIEMPVELEPDGVTVRIAGESGALQDAMADLPPDVAEDVRIERFGTYDPAVDAARRSLTDRQRAVLSAAVDVGYYATPRTATIADVAAAADCAESTASEHLRKIEARLLPRMV